MSDDLLKRMRAWAPRAPVPGRPRQMMSEAADRIAELEAWITDADHKPDCGWRKVPCVYCDDTGWCVDEGWDRYEFGLPGKERTEWDGLTPCPRCNQPGRLVDEFKPTDGKCTCRLDDLRGVS